MEELINQLDLRTVGIILVLLVTDMLFGATRAWKEGKFDAQRLADVFTGKGVKMFIAVLFAVFIRFAAIDTAWETWADGAYYLITGTLTTALLASVLINLKTYLNIDVPEEGIPTGPVPPLFPIDEEI